MTAKKMMMRKKMLTILITFGIFLWITGCSNSYSITCVDGMDLTGLQYNDLLVTQYLSEEADENSKSNPIKLKEKTGEMIKEISKKNSDGNIIYEKIEKTKDKVLIKEEKKLNNETEITEVKEENIKLALSKQGKAIIERGFENFLRSSGKNKETLLKKMNVVTPEKNPEDKQNGQPKENVQPKENNNPKTTETIKTTKIVKVTENNKTTETKEITESVKKPEEATKASGNENSSQSTAASYDSWLTDAIRQQKEDQKKEGHEINTRACLVFVPNLEVVQPAIIQSIGLSNFLQLFCPEADPSVNRTEAKLVLQHYPEIKYKNNKYDITDLDAGEYGLLLDSITKEMMDQRDRENFWLYNILKRVSFDIGIAFPSTNISDKSDSFKRKVDEGFPEFLFGGGFNLIPGESNWANRLFISGGALIYRDKDNHDFKAAAYGGISVSIYQDFIEKKATLNTKK